VAERQEAAEIEQVHYALSLGGNENPAFHDYKGFSIRRKEILEVMKG
jgi:hypothetical protein